MMWRVVSVVSRALTVLTLVGGCGPEPAPLPVDVDAVIDPFCEMVARCADSPGTDMEFCRNFVKDAGVRTGPGSYEEMGCLDEELAYLECLTPMSCEEFQAWNNGELGYEPCEAEMRAVLDAECAPVP